MSIEQITQAQLDQYNLLNTKEILNQAILGDFQDSIGLISSFGAQSAILLHMVSQISQDIPIIFLDTKKHFAKTLEYRDDLIHSLKLRNVIIISPNQEQLSQIDPEGTLWNSQPNRCCWIRKVLPVREAIEKYKLQALINGRKQYQTADRANIDAIEWDNDNQIIKINPLYNYSKEDIEDYYIAHNLPKHPLIKEGYLSIGCKPCTSIPKDGNERSGRWSHTNGSKDECGLH